MVAALTIFAAKYLIFLDAVLVAVVLAVHLYHRPRSAVLGWALTTSLLLVLSYVFAQVGGAIYNDPRPFTVEHFRPLISHAADNGFPSDHALLAAALVALVALVDVPLALPFVLLAIVVDGARVDAGIHHLIDVLGSSVFVALATVIALLIRPVIVRWLVPRLPGWASGHRLPLKRDKHRGT
ncbi:MAG: phosphatase PAP2 family protein [Actinobacteria bacterium]|nr:phosphatase PAP2 family protein [Actinomycetota bacterium]